MQHWAVCSKVLIHVILLNTEHMPLLQAVHDINSLDQKQQKLLQEHQAENNNKTD